MHVIRLAMDGFDPSSDSDSSCWDECQCSWNWDIPEGGGFAPGKDIGFMTYRDMYEKVTTWHMKVAGETLCVHGRLPRKAKPGEAPHIVQFYCSHGRDHGDQSGDISPKQPDAVRANRSNENMPNQDVLISTESEVLPIVRRVKEVTKNEKLVTLLLTPCFNCVNEFAKKA